MATAVTAASKRAAERALATRLRNDHRFYAAEFLTIVDKDQNRIPFVYNDAQVALNDGLQAQREAGKAMRAIALKARQVGVSTACQGFCLQRAVTRANHRARVVAHDIPTGNLLFGMGQGMYSNLPDSEAEVYTDLEGVERPLRPPVRAHRRGRHLHFAQAERDAWLRSGLWPDSEYFVDTANEFQAGRGATLHTAHLSELAFWADISAKLAALLPAVPPNSPDSLVVIESTANGHNHFKTIWDKAVSGESEYFPFFWPWWRETAYRRSFANQAEYEDFRIGDIDQSRYAAEEPDLAERLERFGFELTEIKEKLYWRRATIVNEYAGYLDLFHQEYPSFAEEAFLGTGSRVFDPRAVQSLKTRLETSRAPVRGQLRAKRQESDEGRAGPIEVPKDPLFIPASELDAGIASPWKFWLEADEDAPSGLKVPKSQYVIGVDVSGGEVESEGGEPAFNSIQVIDHFSGEQVAEYVSRVDSTVLTVEVYLAALLFGGEAPVAIEKTGGWGGPVIRILWFDYHYPFVYRRRRHGATSEKQEHWLGWDTTPKTKPYLLAQGQELLASDSTGIRSRELADEMFTYVRDERGRTKPEPGKFADRLMAWLIAEFVRSEIPPRPREDDESGEDGFQTFQPQNPRLGY